ncbi:MAG: SPOR domain-containing protein, partial [Eudoraea sp.]|nr:SPOR domain-containing protein [Eudoraea sp.]
SDIVGVSSGYYLIANVYKNKKYLDAFLKTLNQKGLNAKQFYNTENGLYYVYLADFNTKDDAKIAFGSNLDGQYGDEKWIMEVYNPVASASVEFND